MTTITAAPTTPKTGPRLKKPNRKPKRLSRKKHWSRTSGNCCWAKFGVVIRYTSSWWAFVRFYYSDTPKDLDSYQEKFVCIGKYHKSSHDAMAAVDLAAEQWAKKLKIEPDPRVILMFPFSRLHKRDVFSRLADRIGTSNFPKYGPVHEIDLEKEIDNLFKADEEARG